VEEFEIFTRSSLFSLLLLVAVTLVGTRTYKLWDEGPWALPEPAKAKDGLVSEEARAESNNKEAVPPQQFVSTKNIIEKNLFDPDRGATRAIENQASDISIQRIQSMILLGTAILGAGRYAILRPPQGGGRTPGSTTGQPPSLRLKVGDIVEGFRLSEIQERRVVFTRGNSRAEVAIDYFRPVEPGPERTKNPAQSTPIVPGARPADGRRP